MIKRLNQVAVRGTLCLAVAAGIALAGAGAASAGTPSQHAPARAGSAASDPTVCTSSYDKSAGSLDVSMYNGTDQPLTLDPALTGHYGTGEHWAQQPPAVIEPGQCADMNAYTTDVMTSFAAYATYTLPDGDFVPFTGNIFGDTAYDNEVFTSAPQFSTSALDWSGEQAADYYVQGDWVNGTAHRHITEKLEGGKVDSYPLTSSPISIDGGASTATWKGTCGLGYHVRTNPATNEPMVSFANVSGDTTGFSATSLSGVIADGSVDGATQYQGLAFSLHNSGTNAGTATMSWTCDASVYVAQVPTFVQDSPPASVATGIPVAYRFSALGLPAPTFGLSSGSLPTGLSLNIDGDLTGTPTTPGTYTFAVDASNTEGRATTSQITMVVG